MKIYTRSGDQGSTALFGGGKVSKADARIEAYGSLDELNAVLGMVRATDVPTQIDAVLAKLQNQFFDLGAELACPDAKEHAAEIIQEKDVSDLETIIDSFEANLDELKTFILPGGCSTAATLHLARCVCRRAERQIIKLNHEASVRETILKYVNRTSDLLFVLARSANASAGIEDTAWRKSS